MIGSFQVLKKNTYGNAIILQIPSINNTSSVNDGVVQSFDERNQMEIISEIVFGSICDLATQSVNQPAMFVEKETG